MPGRLAGIPGIARDQDRETLVLLCISTAISAATEALCGEKPPVDMVEKIAQRVVAQVSDKVVREIGVAATDAESHFA